MSHQLTQSTQLILNTFLNMREGLANELRLQAEKIVRIRAAQLSNHIPKGAQEIENYLRGELRPVGTFESPKDTKPPDYENLDTAPREFQIEQELRLLMVENGILSSLAFATMADRQQSLESPHGQTFQWMFEEPGSSDRPWSNFVHWLRYEDGIYWLNGKIGSGKSTLMRYVYENQQTRKELYQWADGFPVEVSGFFFWNSGDEHQRSQTGLLRSLLFNILQRHRDLLPEILSEAWGDWAARAAAVVSSKLPPNSPLLPPVPRPWTMPQLKRAFISLLETLGKKAKLCLFIDGLDEYMGGYLDIIELFEECAELPNIKLCLSSRPLLAFEQAFGDLPGLRLQDLTRGDIGHYVKSRLHSHKYMAQLSERHATDMSLLIKEIVTKSRGVFLWVKLVVRSLLQGLCDRNRMSDLKRRVQYLPEDLEALYAHILKRIDPFYHTQTSQLLQIVRLAQQRSPEQVTLLNLSWADEEEEEMAEDAPILPLTDEEITFRCQTMDARLKSVCAGLLESNDVRFSSIQPDSRVMFLHRTVADWLDKPSVWSGIVSRTADTGFSPHLALLKSCVLNLKGSESSARAPLDMKIASHALEYAKGAEDELAVAFPKLLDQLDIAAIHHWRGRNVSLSGNVQYSESSHWSCAIEVPGLKAAGTGSTFYDLANYMGLTHYVAVKYDAGIIVDQEVSQHLLRQAIPSLSGIGHAGGAQTAPPDPEVVRRILESGTGPNYAAEGMTPWEGVLLDAAWHFARGALGGGADREWHRGAEAWARVLRAFAEHGADPDVVTRRHPRLPGHPRLTPDAVLGPPLLPGFLAPEAAQLRGILRHTRERNARLLLRPTLARQQQQQQNVSKNIPEEDSSDANGGGEANGAVAMEYSVALAARWMVSWFRSG